MKFAGKIFQKLTDPIFYRKYARWLIRRFRSFDDLPVINQLEQLPGLASAVVVIAHPDDEIFCSGLIYELKQRGGRVKLLCLTRGEGGPCGDHSREVLGAVRSREMQRSCEVMGVDELIFLGHVDPVGSGLKVFAPDVSAGDLAAQIRPHFEGADLVISHGSSGEYWHPAHLLVYHAVKLAVDLPVKGTLTWMTFLARQAGHPLPGMVNWDDAPFLHIDNTKHQEARRRSLECHQSQLGLFGKFAGGDYLDFIRLTSCEAYALQKDGNLQVAEAADESKRERNHRADA